MCSEYDEHVESTTISAREYRRFRGNPDFGKGL
jgi:hypothetical protein